MLWYNIIGDNEGSVLNLLWIDPITAGSILITANLVALKRENSEPILIMKITEWSKFVDYFGLSIETDLSRVVKKNIYFVRVGYIPRTSSGNPHISRQQIKTRILIWKHQSYVCIN